MMKREHLILLYILSLSLYLPFTHIQVICQNNERASIDYIIKVNDEGNAKISITIRTENTTFHGWIFVPRYVKYRIMGSKFKIISVNESYFLFYYNLSFFLSENATLTVSWTMPYASIIVGENAFFLSPPINVLPKAKMKISVSLIGVSIHYVDPITKHIKRDYDNITVSYYRLIPGDIFRISIEYSVKGKDIDEYTWHLPKGTLLIVHSPAYYEDLSTRIYNIYRKVYPILSDVINVNVSLIEVMFFSPQHDNVNILGYISLEDSDSPQVIMINPFWIRSLKGAIEQGAVHELVHLLLFNKGLSASRFLWLHEGLAEYLSLTLLIKFNETREWCETKIREYESLNLTGNYLSLLLSWSPSQVIQPSLYGYAYLLIKSLTEDNITKLKEFFSLTPNFKEVTRNEEILALLSVAGMNLTVLKDVGSQINWTLVEYHKQYYINYITRNVRIHPSLNHTQAPYLIPLAIVICAMLLIIAIICLTIFLMRKINM